MKIIKTLFGLFISVSLFGQSKYNPVDLFNPLINYQPSTVFRSGSGNPGSQYWQNHADYKIIAKLDTIKKKIEGNVEITYTNNSPDELGFVWLQLDQNKFKLNSRANQLMPLNVGRYGVKNFDGGFDLNNIKARHDLKTLSAIDTIIINDTRMQIRLNESLAKGQKLKISMDFSFLIPENGSDRMGMMNTPDGTIYEIAQWYPRMCVYDDIEGWNTLPYLGAGEFYLDYGDINYEITVPANQIVMGSGSLTNSAEVLPAKYVERLKKAENSFTTISIINQNDNWNNNKKSGYKTWKFKALNVRDVAWASSNSFLWDATSAKLSNGKKILVQSAYPIASVGIEKWSRATEYLQHSIEFYSKLLMDYPYPVASNIAGIVSGMEYPGIVFCGATEIKKDLFGVIDHEFGHTWFPMIVGSNERKYGWMDEGFNTYINKVSEQNFNNGEYYAPENYQSNAFYFGLPKPILTEPDAELETELGLLTYYKPGAALDILKKEVLGEDRFNYALKEYVKRWAFKHPSPFDFFHTIEDASGEDLGWFWKGMFIENYKLDQGIKSVQYIDGNPANGIQIRIENLEKMAMPVNVQIKEEGIDVKNVKLPVEVWKTGNTWTFNYPSTHKIESVKLNANGILPDINSKNNVWPQEP